jgi:outer membrane protein assembly factor BamB
MSGQDGITLRWSERITVEYEGAYLPVERAVPVLDVERDRVFVGSTGGGFYALTSGGRVIYRYDAGGAIESQAGYDRRRDELFFGTEQGEVHKLRASTGELLWREEASGPLRQPPILEEDVVYFVSDGDVVTALDREDGGSLWTYRREPPEGFSIAAHAGLARAGQYLVTGFTDGTVVALDPRTGAVIWERDTSVDVEASAGGRPQFVDVDTTPFVDGDRLYVASFSAGLYELEIDSGTVLRRDPERTGLTSITADSERLYLASGDHGVICMTRGDHRVLWRHRTRRGSPTGLVVVSGKVLVGESQGSFIALDARTGRERSRFDAGYGFSAPPAVASRRGFVVSNGGSLFAFVL